MTTFADARAYMIALPARRQHSSQWQHAADLLLHSDDIKALTRQLELALLLDGQLRLM